MAPMRELIWYLILGKFPKQLFFPNLLQIGKGEMAKSMPSWRGCQVQNQVPILPRMSATG
jgi:hypothetical protein